MSNAVEVRALSKRFGAVQALDDVSFGVAEGELFGLVGPDGAGKTTLFRVLTTLVEPTAGTATVLGWTRSGISGPSGGAVCGYMPGRSPCIPI